MLEKPLIAFGEGVGASRTAAQILTRSMSSDVDKQFDQMNGHDHLASVRITLIHCLAFGVFLKVSEKAFADFIDRNRLIFRRRIEWRQL